MSNNGKPTLQELLDDTKCKHCGQTFHSIRVPLIGQQARQWADFNMRLQKHLAEKHPDVMAKLVVLTGQFTGMLLMNQFEVADPQVALEQDIARHKIFKLCQRAVVSDETIHAKLATLDVHVDNEGQTSVHLYDVLELIKEFRDVITEALLYPESPIVVLPGSETGTQPKPR